MLNGISEKFCRLWRLLGTVLGFVLFGSGGFLLFCTIFQLISLLSRDKLASEMRVRKFLRYIFRGYLVFFRFIGVLKVDIKGIEDLQKIRGHLIICNHPSLLDVVVIMAYLRNVSCVVKHQLWKHPLLGGVMRQAGYIRNDLAPDQFLEKCQKQINAGDNIIIFPEGTRSIPGQPIKMQRGIGNLALATNANIQSLLMTCEPLSLTKTSKWYEIANQRVLLTLRVGQLFIIREFQSNVPRSLRVRALMREIQQYYERNINYENATIRI